MDIRKGTPELLPCPPPPLQGKPYKIASLAWMDTNRDVESN